MHSLSEAARKALQTMNPAKYEFQSDFAKHYISQGRATLVLKQLAVRFGALPEQARSRIAAASIPELDAIGERLLTAATLAEALGESP